MINHFFTDILIIYTYYLDSTIKIILVIIFLYYLKLIYLIMTLYLIY